MAYGSGSTADEHVITHHHQGVSLELSLGQLNMEGVGMQNSALGVVLVTTHFTSPVVALPPAMSAVIMNIMGSNLGFFWGQISGSKMYRSICSLA
ncbi:hypothetical protein Goshw_025121, partial [Gossypium schwendimanii]|nr:hypothetical protein [Gossypium schwendimanii]